MEENQYKLERSNSEPNYWVLTDIKNGVVIRFEEHRFNETAKITLLEDDPLSGHSSPGEAANDVAKILREMGDYLATHWYSIAMPTPTFEFRETDEGRLFLLRNKSPKFSLEITEDTNNEQLAKALSDAAKFVRSKK